MRRRLLRGAGPRARLVASCLLAVLGFADCRAPSVAVGPGAESPPPPEHTILPGLLRMIVDRDGSQPIVAASLLVDAGWAADPRAKPGLAALVAWLLADAQRASVLALGGVTKVAVGFDASSLVVFAPYPCWRELVSLQARLLAIRPDDLTQAAFERSRAQLVRRLEIGDQWLDRATVLARLAGQVYEATDPYALGGQFSPQAVARITLDDVRAFVATHYRPSRATLYLGGDLPADPKLLREAVAAALPADAPAPLGARDIADGARAGPATPRNSVGKDVPVVRAAVAAPEIWVAWPVPGVTSAEAPLADVAAAEGDRLVRTDWFLADDPEITAASVGIARGARGSLLVARATLVAGASPGRALVVLKRIITTLWATRAVANPREDWRSIQMQVASQLGLDALEGRAQSYPMMDRLTGDPAFVAHALREQLHDMKGSDAKEFVLDYLTADKARAIYVAPDGTSGTPSPAAASVAPAPTSGEPTPAIRAFPSEANPILASQPPRIQTRTLPNGMTAIVAVQATAGSAMVLLGHRGGNADTTPLGAATIAAVAGVFAGGRLDCVALPGCGVLALPGLVDEDRSAFLAVADPAALPDTLTAFARRQFVDWVEWPNGEAAKRFVALRRASETRPDSLSVQRLFARVLPTPAVHQVPPVASLLAISSDAVKSSAHAQSGARNSAIVVVGPVDPAHTFAQIERAFADWEPGADRGSTSRPASPAVNPPAEVPILTTPWPGSSRARVSFACRLPPAQADDDAWRALLAQHIAAGLDAALLAESSADGMPTFGGRRDVYAGRASDVFVDGLVSPRAVNVVVAALRRMVAELGQGKVPNSGDDPNLDGARWRAVTRHAFDVGSPERLARELFAEWSHGQQPDGGTRALAGLGRLDPGRMEALARSCHASAVISLAVDPAFYPKAPPSVVALPPH